MSQKSLTLQDDDIQTVIDVSLDETKEDSIEKMTTHRATLRHSHNDVGQAARESRGYYESNPAIYAYGKKLRGVITQKIKETTNQNVNLFVSSEALSDETLYDLFKNCNNISIATI